MLDAIDPRTVLFLDIETVSVTPDFDGLSDDMQDLWRKKAGQLQGRDRAEPLEEEAIADLYRDRAAIYAEFGSVVCISVGVLQRSAEDSPYTLHLKSFYGDDEARVLREFQELVAGKYAEPQDPRDRFAPPRFYFCGHNIREFDLPYLCRRMVVHRIPFPPSLQLAGKKPWESKHLLDTMELWKFGDRKSYSSLHALAVLLGIPSPKSDMDGSGVGTAFWQEQAHDRIARYCERDVLATAQLFLRYRLEDLLDEEQQVKSRTFD